MDIDSSSTVTETTPSVATEAVPAVTEATPAPAPASSGESGQTDANASSSDAPEQAETRESLLDVVKQAVAPKTDAAPTTTDELAEGAAPAPGENKDPNAPGELPDEPSQEELQAYTPRTRKRIEQLLNERKTLRQEVETLRPEAETAKSVKEFLVSNDIAKDDFALVLDLAAAMRRGDFQAFLAGVTPYVQLAQESLGIVLPADLQQAVQTGHMTPQAAQVMAQERSARQLAEARAIRTEQLAAQRNEQAMRQTQEVQVQAFQRSVEQAVAGWEAQQRKQDPDFAQKEPVVRDFLHAVVNERGAPRSPQEAVAIAQEAYDRANRAVQRFRPQPRPTQAVPSSINRMVGAKPEPKSMLEAAQQALGR
jgi:hypothetical protein